MTDEENITAAVYGAIAGIVLRGHGVNPQQIVAALDRVHYSLAQVRAHWQKQAEEYLVETNLRTLRTEPVQVASILSIRQALSGSDKMQYTTAARPQNRLVIAPRLPAREFHINNPGLRAGVSTWFQTHLC